MAFKMALTFDKIMYKVDSKPINPSFPISKLPPGVKEVPEIFNTLPSLTTMRFDEIT